mmetsp:Transcript_11766/g.28545  ORF Transcript_11766/g.28545 Transcript_11766/m.28545 type:complete len:405 (-) Transcript_11766:3753-4967(-)
MLPAATPPAVVAPGPGALHFRWLLSTAPSCCCPPACSSSPSGGGSSSGRSGEKSSNSGVKTVSKCGRWGFRWFISSRMCRVLALNASGSVFSSSRAFLRGEPLFRAAELDPKSPEAEEVPVDLFGTARRCAPEEPERQSALLAAPKIDVDAEAGFCCAGAVEKEVFAADVGSSAAAEEVAPALRPGGAAAVVEESRTFASATSERVSFSFEDHSDVLLAGFALGPAAAAAPFEASASDAPFAPVEENKPEAGGFELPLAEPARWKRDEPKIADDELELPVLLPRLPLESPAFDAAESSFTLVLAAEAFSPPAAPAGCLILSAVVLFLLSAALRSKSSRARFFSANARATRLVSVAVLLVGGAPPAFAQLAPGEPSACSPLGCILEAADVPVLLIFPAAVFCTPS